MHIGPYLGTVKLSKLTAPMISEFRNDLREGKAAPGQETGFKRSPAMVKKIMGSLSSLLTEAYEAGYVAQNVARSMSRKKKKTKAEQRRKLKVGVDIPKPDEVKAIMGRLEGRWKPLFLVAFFAGLRSSELRGLRWEDVDLAKGELQVNQRMDRFNKVDVPKSEAGERTVPLSPMVVSALREWKLACPKGPLGLVFPNGAGKPKNRGNIVNRGWIPAQLAAGICAIAKDKDGKVVLDAKGEPVRVAKYPGLHAARHFYASWCINRRVDNGLELPMKVVQERLGHSTLAMTADRYGHLFPKGDDKAELAAGERFFLAT